MRGAASLYDNARSGVKKKAPLVARAPASRKSRCLGAKWTREIGIMKAPLGPVAETNEEMQPDKVFKYSTRFALRHHLIRIRMIARLDDIEEFARLAIVDLDEDLPARVPVRIRCVARGKEEPDRRLNLNLCSHHYSVSHRVTPPVSGHVSASRAILA